MKKTFAAVKNTATFFLAVVNAFNPFYYRSIAQKSLLPIIVHTLYLLVIIALAAAALAIPYLASMHSDTSLNLHKFSKFTIKAEIATNGPIEEELPLLGNVKVFANTTASPEKQAQYDVSLTNNELKVKPLLCFFRNELCRLLGVKQQPVQIREFDLVKDSARASSALSALMLIMLPGLLILLYFTMLAKYVVIAIAAGAICYAALKLAKRDTGLLDALKITSYALTALIVLDAAAFLLRNTAIQLPAFLPLAGYSVLVIAAAIANEQGNSNSRI